MMPGLARRISHSGYRRMSLVSALILGGRVADAEVELAKLESPEERADMIGSSLLTEFRVGCSTQMIMSHHQ